MLLDQPTRILIIDDEPSNIESLFEILHKENYQIAVAANSKEGILVAQETLPSLIIMDWDMPEVDGIEATKILRADTETSTIPIIIATGKMLTSYHLKVALQAGANDFIRKPLDTVETLARVQAMLRFYETSKLNLELQTKVHNQKMATLALELETKKQELKSTTMHHVENNKQVEKLMAKLKSLAIQSNENFPDQVMKILDQYKYKTTVDNWDEFDKSFVNVYANFYEKLCAMHTNLTTNEKRMCAFSKMGLTNKEVGSLTDRSEEAIKKAKFRLRKKLNIGLSVLTEEYMQQF